VEHNPTYWRALALFDQAAAAAAALEAELPPETWARAQEYAEVRGLALLTLTQAAVEYVQGRGRPPP
jgi:hypothetical protein